MQNCTRYFFALSSFASAFAGVALALSVSDLVGDSFAPALSFAASFFASAFAARSSFALAAFASFSFAFAAFSSLALAAFSSRAWARADFSSFAAVALSSAFVIAASLAGAVDFAGADAAGAAAGAGAGNAAGAVEGGAVLACAAGAVAPDERAGAACDVPGIVVRPETEIWSRILPNSPSLMPRTFMMSSDDLKGPFALRYSMIACALTGPIPGSASSSACEAVLMLTAARAIADVSSNANPSNSRFMSFSIDERGEMPRRR